VLFYLFKQYARFVLRIFCRKIIINKPALLKAKGPLLFTANHPNSFLDGIILTTLLEETLYSLARGDAFKGPWNKLLRGMHLLPVYRTSEGVENLAHNYTTFRECHQVFERGGIVLIFSEGGCLNEWKLRPLRKGTARLATSAWQKGIDLTVVPLGFNYNSFKNFGKNVHLLFGEPLQRASIMAHQAEGRQLLEFNQQLQQQLQGLVYDIDPDDTAKRKRIFEIPVSRAKWLLLAVPAALGWLLHAPVYYLARAVAQRFFNNDHFDGVVVGLLLLLYPVYLLLSMIFAAYFIGWWALILLVLLPFFAWACVQLKPQTD
jgi:1-acyl-sn-glycerol-3-phosphate acyltransferase